MDQHSKYEAKARDLVARMTLDEKISQLTYQAPAIKRLGVPAYNWWNEALHGVARAGTATSYPQAIGLAATFDPELLTQIADAIAVEGRAKYNQSAHLGDRDIYKGLTFWSPNINIFRDPRWGRGHETYGEDPYLSGRMGVAFIKGLQGDKEIMKAAACAKHFAVHSGPENLRHEFDAVVSDKDLWETYLPAFEACVTEAKVEAVMGAYNRTNGEPCCGSYFLLRDVLRGLWNFRGHVVSDCWAIKDFHEHHHVTNTPIESVALALDAGCDLNCGNMYLHLYRACSDGLVSEGQIDLAVTRLFTTRYKLGLFEQTEFDEISFEKIECPEHLALSLIAAEESIVLLKNDGALPLNAEKIRTIGVIGPNANSRLALKGNYYGTSSRYVTPLDAILDEVRDKARVLYAQGSELTRDRTEGLAMANDRIWEAVSVANHSDVVILFLGLDETLEGEERDEGNQAGSGDKEDLLLPEVQRRLLEEVIRTQKPVILCMMAGSSIDISYADEHCAAILQAWYPGALGGKAIADILFGRISPSGKLPVTFYRSTYVLPDFTDYSMKRRTYRYLEAAPLYPFGFGLTYGRLTCEEVDICEDEDTEGEYSASVSLQNSTDRDIQEVLQVYINAINSEYSPPNPVLCAFKRVSVHAGERSRAMITIPKTAFYVVDLKGNRCVPDTDWMISIGFSQSDERSRELMNRSPLIGVIRGQSKKET